MNRSRPALRGRSPWARRALLLPVLLALGCAQQRIGGGGEGLLSLAPTMSVERFLQASNARDFESMARLFGTASGPVAETGGAFGCAFRRIGSWIGMGSRCVRNHEVELRMAAIADILFPRDRRGASITRDYQVISERPEPGRRSPANRVGVDFTMGNRVVRDVSFIVVRSDGRWLVQEIELQKVTGS